MKRTFVLDLNILINPSENLFKLVEAIATNCHKIAASLDVLNLYLRRWGLFERRVSRIVRDLMRDPEKFEFRQEVTPLGYEQLIPDPQDDVHFVRISADVKGSILVTTDMPLIDAVKRESQQSVVIMHPKDAILLAGPTAS